MRTVITFLALLAFSFPTWADDTPETKKRIEELEQQIAAKKAELVKLEAELSRLRPAFEWKKGATGELPQIKNGYYYVFRVVAPGEVVVGRAKRIAGNREIDDGPPFLVKGVPTAGLQALRPIELKGKFKVTGEHLLNDKAFKAYDGSSVWVIEVQK